MLLPDFLRYFESVLSVCSHAAYGLHCDPVPRQVSLLFRLPSPVLHPFVSHPFVFRLFVFYPSVFPLPPVRFLCLHARSAPSDSSFHTCGDIHFPDNQPCNSSPSPYSNSRPLSDGTATPGFRVRSRQRPSATLRLPFHRPDR